MQTTEEKAKTTLKEADVILSSRVCANAAANRYYFAVIQMVYCFQVRKGLPDNPRAKGGNHEHAHRIIKNNMERHHRRTLNDINNLRVKADYKSTNVSNDDLSINLIQNVKGLFEALAS